MPYVTMPVPRAITADMSDESTSALASEWRTARAVHQSSLNATVDVPPSGYLSAELLGRARRELNISSPTSMFGALLLASDFFTRRVAVVGYDPAGGSGEYWARSGVDACAHRRGDMDRPPVTVSNAAVDDDMPRLCAG